MTWGAPYALLLLAGAIPLILLLHSLKPRGLKIRTTTLFLWERVLRERPLGTRLGWLLRKNLLLLLQIIAAVALIAALADPTLRQFGAPEGHTVAVVDLSASMKANGRLGSRFEAARKELLALVESLRGGRKMMIIGAGPQPRLIVPFTEDKKRLREAARALGATDAPGQVKEAILFAHGFLRRGSPDRVVVISDGAFAGAEEFARPAPHLRIVKVEGGENNVGIVGFEVRREPGRPSVEAMVHVRNFTAKTQRAPLTLAFGEKTIAREMVDLEPDGRRVLIFPFESLPAGTLNARLEIADDFAIDNQAFLAVGTAAPVRLLYVGPGNPFLNNLLRFFPNVQLSSAPSAEAAAAQPQGEFDVVIFDRVPAPPLTRGNFILIDTLAPNLPLKLQGKILRPRLDQPLARHPITEGMVLGDLSVQESLRLAVSGDGVVLARAGGSPLLFAFEKDRLRLLVIGFDLLASDLPLRVAFPLLFHNVLEWFQPRRMEFPAESVRAGTPVALRLAAGDDAVELTAPSGKKETFQTGGAPFFYPETLETGVYAYKSASREGRFAVNLLDEEESQIASRLHQAGPAPAARQSDSAVTVEAGFALWPALLAIALLLLGLELLLAFRSGMALYPAALRACVLATLALALVNPRIFQATNALDVILGVDLSRSVGQEGREKAGEVLEAAGRVSRPETRTGLIAFGRSPEWEFLPRREFSIPEFSARLDREQTDIQSALQAALAQLGEGRQGRILLVSDGNENRGASARSLPLLRSQGVQVWTLPVSLARGQNEVYLSDLELPHQVDAGAGFEVAAAIESLRPASARVKFLRDGNLHKEIELQLTAGTNRVSFPDNLLERGSHSYELLVEAGDDTLAENNLLQGVVEVRGPPRVLLLSAQKNGQRLIPRALSVQGYAVVESAPEAHSLSLAELSTFDLLILDNVAAFQLSQAKMENIEKYVRDQGGGLLVIGGAQSYGAGGYYRTPLERILPVDMRPPARLDVPHVALLFVIDKSGSMGAGPEGGTKLDLAKAAAIAAADIMNPTDQVGILAFDAAWDWVLPFRQVNKGEWISEKLADLQSDGGTDIFKALVEAHRGISAKRAAIKHVILLSDGLTDKADFPALIGKMARDGITVSTVSVGNDADVALMAAIAKDGKGRGYVALDPQTIPQIFTTETLLISRDLLIEKPVMPTIVSTAGPVKGIAQESLPALRGYVLTYPKPRAELFMKADNDPLLVSWRHGLGRVTAFTSDLSGRWGRDWLAWQGLPRWTSQVARDTMRRLAQTTVQAQFKDEGDHVGIVADLVSRSGKFINQLQIKSNLSAPNRATETQIFRQTAPGRYEAKFTPSRRGIHFFTLFAEGAPGEAPLALTTVPYVAPYPKEYRELKPNLALLSRLAEETGGEMVDPTNIEAAVKRLYTPTPGKGTLGREIWWPLAGAGLLLFLADLVLRVWPQRPQAYAPAAG